VNLVSNREFEGVTGTGGSGLIDWHGDMNFTTPATDFVALDAVELPESGGGATRFADLCAAYDALSSHEQSRIELAEVRYFFRSDLSYAKLSDAQRQSLRSVTHPLVQTRFPSRRRSLWPNVGIFDGYVVGHDDGSRELLDTLLRHATHEDRVYEHEWVQGDCAIWSNWTIFHQRLPFDDRHRRRMRHLTISEGGPQP
jgi:alpha-ketoglutarate-dependent taurine dioxygenase